MRVRSLFALGLTLVFVGCRQDMHDQPKYEPLEASEIFDNGASSRPFPAGTVARGDLRADPILYTGVGEDGRFVETSPLPMERSLLERGQRGFNAFCTPCHGRRGDGLGMIVRRGFKQPTSFHDARLRETRIGQFFHVMTNGFGQMSSYAAQIPVDERWAIAAYIRVLQMSYNAPLGRLTAEDLAALADSGHAELHTPEAAEGH